MVVGSSGSRFYYLHRRAHKPEGTDRIFLTFAARPMGNRVLGLKNEKREKQCQKKEREMLGTKANTQKNEWEKILKHRRATKQSGMWQI